jgi:heptosyltransferase-3
VHSLFRERQLDAVAPVEQQPVERVLLYRLGSLGDTLVALPAFHLVRESFPRAEITLLTNIPSGKKAAALVSILQGTHLYQHVVSYPLHLRSPTQLSSLRAQIASRKFQVAIHLAESRGPLKNLRDWLFLRSCGITRIIGVPCRLWEPAGEGQPALQKPETHRLMERLAPLGEVNLEEEKWWDLHLSTIELREGEQLLQQVPVPYLAVSVGTKADANDWTEPNWRTLLSRASGLWPGLSLIMLGAASERELSNRCSRGWLGPKLNLCGMTTPRVSAAVLRQAKLFVGHDSGPMHLAATVGTPCVGIFSARNPPGRWFPRGKNNTILYHKTECFGCGLEKCLVHQKKCILSITAQEVVAAMEKYLTHNSKNVAFVCDCSTQSVR